MRPPCWTGSLACLACLRSLGAKGVKLISRKKLGTPCTTDSPYYHGCRLIGHRPRQVVALAIIQMVLVRDISGAEQRRPKKVAYVAKLAHRAPACFPLAFCSTSREENPGAPQPVSPETPSNAVFLSLRTALFPPRPSPVATGVPRPQPAHRACDTLDVRLGSQTTSKV